MGIIYSRDRNLMVVSQETIQQADNVIILGAGPSLDASKKKVQQWSMDRNAIMIGAQHKYFLKPTYTVFRRPARFKRWQGILPGTYIVDERIDPKTIKYRNRTLYLEYHKSYAARHDHETKTSLQHWGKGEFFIKSDSVPYDSPGWHGIFIAAAYCRPKNILIAGIDGHIDKGKITKLGHAKCVDYGGVKNCGKQHKISGLKKLKNLLHEKERSQHVPKVLKYIVHVLGVNVHICKEAYLHGVDKKILEKIGVNII